MPRPSLPKTESADDLDKLDLEIVAALEVDPKTPCRIIAEKTGVGVTTVWDRIQRIRKSDWVEQMRIDLKALGGISLDAVQNGMVLGDVIAVEAEALGSAQQQHAVIKNFRQRFIAPVDVIENPELH